MRFILILFLIVGNLSAGTYYIDWVGGNDANNGTSSATPWKRAPGMPSFAGSGYSHAAGDIFYFKFGVTWPSTAFPWVIANSGSAGNVDTYTTLNGFGTGAQPIFDGENTSVSGGMIQAVSKSYFAFNNLNIINDGVALATDGLNTLDFLDCHHLSVTNCVFATYSWHSIYIHWNTATTYNSYTITGNDFSHTTSALWFASSVGSMTVDGLTYQDNTIHDFSSQIGGGTHGDGFIHIFGAAAFTNINVSRNRAYGDFTRGFSASPEVMTSFIFFEAGGGVSGIIANNVLAPTTVMANNYESFITMSGTGNDLIIANNSLNNPGVNSASAGLFINGTGTYTVANNVCAGLLFAAYLYNGASYTYTLLDYNCWASTSGSLATAPPTDTIQNYATWQAAGRDTPNSILGSDPLYISSSNLALQSGSPCKTAGVDLSAYFTTDYTGATRPTGAGTWSMGAYQYSASGGSGGSTLTGKITITGKATIK